MSGVNTGILSMTQTGTIGKMALTGGADVEFTYTPSGGSIEGKALSMGGSATFWGINFGFQVNQPLNDDNSINTDIPRSYTVTVGTKGTNLGFPFVLCGEGHIIKTNTENDSIISIPNDSNTDWLSKPE